jgi:hypothetical protein
MELNFLHLSETFRKKNIHRKEKVKSQTTHLHPHTHLQGEVDM